MSLNKKILAAAVVSSLFATAAHAVTLSSGGTTSPVTLASEIVATTTAKATITNGGALNIVTPLNYAFSSGEVRYARVECSSNVQFATNSTATYQDDVVGTDVTGAVSLGAINGLGTSAISFSVTANNEAVGNETTDTFTITGDRILSSTAGASCSYALYDQPSQAAAGGTDGRIAATSGQYFVTQSGYAFTATSNTTTANVEADPAFTGFVSAAPTNSTTKAQLAAVSYNVRTGDQLGVGGVDVTLANLFGATTNIGVSGDFTAARNADGTYTGTALTRVFLSTAADCSSSALPAASVSATAARFDVGATAFASHYVCLTTQGSLPIPAGDYTATLNAVAATPAVYLPLSTGPLAAGAIVRNGTQLQAPLVQLPTGYLARIALTNTGGADRPYTISVQGEPGNTISTANLTGTVPANGTRVIDLNTVLTGFSTQTRATLNVTVAGPDKQVQGLYQIVKPDTGSISNHVMVRPGSN